MPTPSALPQGGDLVQRHRLPTRLWHWLNALSVIVMLMSGLMIFNAHPHLYWGQFGANPDHSWLDIYPGHVRIGPLHIPTPGLLGVTPAGGRFVAFPPLLTLPSHYDLAGARVWHFAFAWLLVVPGLAFLVWGVLGRHFRRDLLPRPGELQPRHLLADIRAHARLRFPTGAAALHYNILQKLAYGGVIFVLLPGVVLTGLTMSPGMDAAWPWLLTLFGGRASARSIHFLCAMGLAAFLLVHLLMVVLAGPLNEIRSMITGRYRLPKGPRS
ncbi:cytochrome b/b6 domain-containing protein [Sphingomonas morindae]|uniref:Cytochrome b/b6 domain-containing protein n=1 Tax=Sphingomonas morindae TaxID=1541170 RepID=A0ABY4XD27_9SPHN|nr:cytochrome b/b6 domain-containing protein [Sphingomonas morindae]USI74867.1 cytochrome b/b6 domain-containing protein [Sphingomonas morindae]